MTIGKAVVLTAVVGQQRCRLEAREDLRLFARVEQLEAERNKNGEVFQVIGGEGDVVRGRRSCDHGINTQPTLPPCRVV